MTFQPMTRARRRRGANAIEFALTLPIFLALVLGTMDYGLIFMTQARPRQRRLDRVP